MGNIALVKLGFRSFPIYVVRITSIDSLSCLVNSTCRTSAIKNAGIGRSRSSSTTIHEGSISCVMRVAALVMTVSFIDTMSWYVIGLNMSMVGH